MDRKSFLKCSCALGIGSCFGIGLIGNEKLQAAVKNIPVTDDGTPVIAADARQIQNVLSYIDSNMDESVKKAIFDKLGYEHITHTDFKNWIISQRDDLKEYFGRINSNKDTYWEKIEYVPESSAIKITGKKVDKCACAYAQHENPPLSLCNYCCKNFQVGYFELLFDKKVIKVDIDESFLLGGERCSSTVYIDGKIEI